MEFWDGSWPSEEGMARGDVPRGQPVTVCFYCRDPEKVAARRHHVGFADADMVILLVIPESGPAACIDCLLNLLLLAPRPVPAPSTEEEPDPADFPNYIIRWSFKLLDLVKELDALDVPVTTKVVVDLGAFGPIEMIVFRNRAAQIKAGEPMIASPAYPTGDPALDEGLLDVRNATAPVRACRVCGCTDDRACPGGCYWVEADLCSACGK